MSDKLDVVIVGAGIGGLIVGALLAKKERMSVLILEKASTIGGRVMSFGGPHGSYTEKEFRKVLHDVAGFRILRTEPSLAEIIEKKGLFTNFITDCGWHGISTGSRNRCSLIAQDLGKTLRVVNEAGLFVDVDGNWADWEASKDWPSESKKERARVVAERMKLSARQAAEYDHVDLKSYLESETKDQRVRDYYVAIARAVYGINDPSVISAGEWIKTYNLIAAAGSRGGMGQVEGGYKRAAEVYAEIIEECGGEIRTNAKVEKVVIKDGVATGVVVEQNGSTSTIEASIVISDLPMLKVFEIVPESCFPKVPRDRIKDMLPYTGIQGFLCVKELLETQYPKGVFIVRELPGTKVRGGAAFFGFMQATAIDPTKILRQGQGHIVQTWVALWSRDPDERTNKQLLNELIDAQLTFLRKKYPQLDDILDWYMFTLPEFVAPPPAAGYMGDMRPGVKHPTVRNLYFTGDTVTQWDFGVSGATHGSLNCVSAITGKDYLKMLPPYMR